jgi:arginase family enzyme
MKLIKAPFSGGSLGKNRGCEHAPDAILKEFEQCYLPESHRPGEYQVQALELMQSNIDKSFELVEQCIGSLSERFIMLGGDHSLTYPAFKAFSALRQNSGLLVFDAHPDLINDFSPPTHEDYLKVLISEGLVKPDNIILVGVRNPDPKELGFIRQHNIRVFWMKACTELGVRELAPVIMENARKFGSLYLSIDIDCVDPAFAPGTGYPEPGGFSSRDMLYIVQKLRLLQNLIGADIVEVNPEKDLNSVTSRLAARLLRELL